MTQSTKSVKNASERNEKRKPVGKRSVSRERLIKDRRRLTIRKEWRSSFNKMSLTSLTRFFLQSRTNLLAQILSLTRSNSASN